jgi:glycosyltransferase involved in cell wall biosynthesis
MMDLSIVIPAFNESKKIGADVAEAAAFLHGAALTGEVIVVDDGSRDHTAEIASAAGAFVIRLAENRGKGRAVQAGVGQSGGQVVLVADSGSCVPYKDALPAVQRIQSGLTDLALASRNLKQTVIVRDRPLRRRILSRFFRLAARAVVGIPHWISDPQCGFKVYDGKIARELFSSLQTDGFLFELEITLGAVKRDCRIEEFPIHWSCDPDTRLHPAAMAGKLLRELLHLRRQIRR